MPTPIGTARAAIQVTERTSLFPMFEWSMSKKTQAYAETLAPINSGRCAKTLGLKASRPLVGDSGSYPDGVMGNHAGVSER